MIITLIISLGLITSAPSTPETEIAPKQTAIIFKDQQVVYDIPAKKKGRK